METVECGANVLAGTEVERILSAVKVQYVLGPVMSLDPQYYFGTGDASLKISQKSREYLESL